MKSDFSTSLVFACIVLVLLARIEAAAAAATGGGVCPRGAPGSCLPVIKCLPALKSIRQTGGHSFKRCGFQDSIEIVCCPDDEDSGDKPPRPTTTTTTTTTSKTILRNPGIRKSLEACEEFTEMVGPRLTYQILGGEDARLGEFPHMAAIGFKPEDEDELNWSCGASLISQNYALTAAHCFIKRDGRKPVKVRMGVVNITGDNSVSPKDYDIANITLHPQYNRKTKQNDIALIKLSSAVEFSQYVAPACLYQKYDNPAGLVVTGWGTTEPAGETSEILQKAVLEPVSVEVCNINHTSLLLGKPITATQICAKSPDGRKDTCQGDSGGPLQIQMMKRSSIYTVVGITSYGRSCGGTVPSVYTRVYSFLDWIEKIVWP